MKSYPVQYFMIIPILDYNEYKKRHFKRIYENVIKPGREKANHNALRPDDVEEIY